MEKLKNIALYLFLSVFIASLCFNVHYCSMRPESYGDTVRTTFVDTVTFYNPVPKDSTVIRYVTVKLPTSVSNFPESKQDFSETIPDSADIVLPITQKIYKNNIYTAYVSGYNPSLDSLTLQMPHEIITIKENQKPKRWSVGVQMGYGVMLIKGTPQFSPYVGVGVQYNLFRF